MEQHLAKHTKDFAKSPAFEIFFVTLDKVNHTECLKRYCHYTLAQLPINTQCEFPTDSSIQNKAESKPE